MRSNGGLSQISLMNLTYHKRIRKSFILFMIIHAALCAVMFSIDTFWIRCIFGVIAVLNIIGNMYYISYKNSQRREELTKVANGEVDEQIEEAG